MQNNFNFVAPFYDLLAQLIFGKSIKNSQAWLLPFIPENAKILIIGGGSGWILEEFLKLNKPAEIVYLEASEKMLELSKKRYAESKKNNAVKVDLRSGTEAALSETEAFDVIFTGFLLDLFQPEPLQELMQKLYGHLNQKGLWLLADFCPRNATKFWQKSLLKTMVQFFKLTANLQANKLPDLEKAIANFALILEKENYFYHRLIRSAVYRRS